MPIACLCSSLLLEILFYAQPPETPTYPWLWLIGLLIGTQLIHWLTNDQSDTHSRISTKRLIWWKMLVESLGQGLEC